MSKAPPQDGLGFLVADLARAMRAAFAHELEGSGLTLAQARALLYVARHEGLRQVELAELLEVQPITLARLVDTLEQAGVVERRADPQDRRAYRIFLTPAAGPLLASIERTVAAIRRRSLQGIDAEEAARVMAALRLMRENLSGVKPVSSASRSGGESPRSTL